VIDVLRASIEGLDYTRAERGDPLSRGQGRRC
jgi:hypothetical protein